MKIIWHSAPPFNLTGYGIQTREWVKRLMLAGHEVWIVPNCQTNYAASFTWNGFNFLPPGILKYGLDGVYDACIQVDADMVITLMDAHPITTDFGKELCRPWYPMFPIDHDPLPEAIERLVKQCERPLAMSKAGFDLLKGYDPVLLRHGVDCTVYQPSEPTDIGQEGKFVVGMVAANVGTRKAYNENMQAFAKFHKKHPDSVLYAHCYVDGRRGGLNLKELAKALDISDSFIYPQPYLYLQGYTSEEMAGIYSAFDVLLASTRAEGFGVPIIEAQACGTPVIVTDFGAQKENCGVGWTVEGKKVWTVLNSWRRCPEIDSIVEALEIAYENRCNRTLRAQARNFATHYHFDNLFVDEWVPFLDSCCTIKE